jgi:hypothetical protein
MNDIQCKIFDVRCVILKFIVFVTFFYSGSITKAQTATVIDSAEILRRIAFQDSIFNHLSDVKPYKPSIKKEVLVDSSLSIQTIDSSQIIMPGKKDDSLSLSLASNKKIKKQKKIDTTHYSPKKAAIWAAGFPGLGQIYMKKYWKLPIVYGLLGGVLYFVISNGQKLKKFNGYIRNVYDSIPNPSPYDELDLSNLETYRNGYRKNVQLASFGTVFAWGLSIVDAVVDAHLHSYDISDKLAIKVKPQINYSNFTYYTGIGVNLTFK